MSKIGFKTTESLINIKDFKSRIEEDWGYKITDKIWEKISDPSACEVLYYAPLKPSFYVFANYPDTCLSKSANWLKNISALGNGSVYSRSSESTYERGFPPKVCEIKNPVIIITTKTKQKFIYVKKDI